MIIPEYKDDPKYKYKLKVIASDVTERKMLILPDDAKDFGIDPDKLSVAEAVRMSMSFPLFFIPIRKRKFDDKKVHLIVDGGLLSNFPVWLFDSDGEPEWPTFGVKLVDDDLTTSTGDRESLFDIAQTLLGPIVPFIWNMVSTALEAHDRLYIENHNFVRTIPVPSLGISTLNFALSTNNSEDLFQSGRNAANKFLKTWNFTQYVNLYRSGKKDSRRESLNLAEK